MEPKKSLLFSLETKKVSTQKKKLTIKFSETKNSPKGLLIPFA